jgi:CelD/BcsL family acetyltransferase involved in cellulose biosynthesis
MSLSLAEVPIADVASDQALVQEWRRLSAETPGASYFQTPDWVLSWWRTLGDHSVGDVAVVRADNALAGLFALAKTRESLSNKFRISATLASNAGSGLGADHAGWLASDGATDLLVDWVRDKRPVLLRGIPIEVGEALGGRLIDVQRCPRVDVEQVPKLMSSKLAKNLRYARRKLADEKISFDWKPAGAVTPSDLAHLYRLHRLRRLEVGHTPVFENEARKDFHDELLKWSDDVGGTAVVRAIQDDTVVGVLYGFMWRDTFAYYQIGWDPAFRKLSLGSVLVMEAIDACSAHGIKEFDFLRGPEDYKYRFGATDVVEGAFACGRSPGLVALEMTHRLRRRPHTPSVLDD